MRNLANDNAALREELTKLQTARNIDFDILSGDIKELRDEAMHRMASQDEVLDLKEGLVALKVDVEGNQMLASTVYERMMEDEEKSRSNQVLKRNLENLGLIVLDLADETARLTAKVYKLEDENVALRRDADRLSSLGITLSDEIAKTNINARKTEGAVEDLAKTVSANATMTSLALNDVNLTSASLSDTHTGNLYTSNDKGEMSVLGESNGKLVDEAKQRAESSYEVLDLTLDSDTLDEIEAAKSDYSDYTYPDLLSEDQLTK